MADIEIVLRKEDVSLNININDYLTRKRALRGFLSVMFWVAIAILGHRTIDFKDRTRDRVEEK